MPRNQDLNHRGPILPPKQSLNLRAVGMALGAHALLLLALVLNLDWKTENQGPMQIELWADGITPTAAPAQSTKPEVKPEPTPPKPEPEPEPVKPPPPPEPPPPPAPPAVVETPKNEIDPEIALENERKKKAEKERLEKELAEKKAKEEERKEKDRIKREKDAAEKKERERLEQIDRVEKEKKEKKEKEEKEKKAVAEKKEKEKKEKEEKEKKLAEEKKAKEAKEAAAKKAAADQAFKDAMRGDVMGAAGMPGGTADRNQAGGGNYSGYGAKIRACVQPGVSFPAPPQSGSNPTVQYRVQLKSDGTVSGVKLLKTSGNSNFDQAVERGISRCTPFPKPDSGSYPSYIDVDYRMY